MRKKFVISGTLFLLVIAGVLLYFCIPYQPFKHITTEQVDTITTSSISVHGVTEKAALSADRQEELLSILHEIKVPRNQNVDWTQMAGGQYCEFFISLQDGTEEYLIIQIPDNFGHNRRNYEVPEEICRLLDALCQEVLSEVQD